MISQAFNSKVKDIKIKIGDIVLNEVRISVADHQGNFRP